MFFTLIACPSLNMLLILGAIGNSRRTGTGSGTTIPAAASRTISLNPFDAQAGRHWCLWHESFAFASVGEWTLAEGSSFPAEHVA